MTYIFSDHLGSTSITAGANGTLRSRTLYYPWGEVRYQTGALPTDYTYTGQYSYTDAFGLMYYNARWYDPALGRFTQADTLIPGAGNPLAWDRYAYTNNNPLRYTDPSGHWLCKGKQECSPADGEYELLRRLSLLSTMIKGACESLECHRDNVGWITVDLSVVQDKIGYNLGRVRVPVHTDINYSIFDNSIGKWERKVNPAYLNNPNLLFPWEGPALVVYSEERQFYLAGDSVWVDATIGILNTMYARMANDEKWHWPDYTTVNEAAFSSYAIPQVPEKRYGGINEPRFADFEAVTIGWYLFLQGTDDQPMYDFFAHRHDGSTCFGYTAGYKSFCIP